VTRSEFLGTLSAGLLAAPPDSAIRRSMEESLRFTVERTLVPYNGKLASKSSFVNAEGEIMEWHDFGPLEGPGWAANAVGGAYEIYRHGRFAGNEKRCAAALAILDHVLEDGFIDDATGIIRPYRHTATNAFVMNYKHNNSWLCPGSMAKIGYQLLIFADVLPNGARKTRMRNAARGCAAWVYRSVKPTDSGWYPRRCTLEGAWFPWRPGEKNPRGGADPLFDGSADGLFVLQLMTALSERDLEDYTSAVRRRLQVFMDRGGIFGSINHDVYDSHENVAYAVAFRVLRQAARVLNDSGIRSFAYEKCLAGLDPFIMAEDRNGVATKGLLYMCKSWDTAYLWENAEAALAWLEAYGETKNRRYLRTGLGVLEAIARHHHGPHGFLTEGVDWNNHVGRQHHFNRAEYGDIQYTEPFLNNQHIAEPTLLYLEHFARPPAM